MTDKTIAMEFLKLLVGTDEGAAAEYFDGALLEKAFVLADKFESASKKHEEDSFLKS